MPPAQGPGQVTSSSNSLLGLFSSSGPGRASFLLFHQDEGRVEEATTAWAGVCPGRGGWGSGVSGGVTRIVAVYHLKKGERDGGGLLSRRCGWEELVACMCPTCGRVRRGGEVGW